MSEQPRRPPVPEGSVDLSSPLATALRQMSLRGPVVNLETGETVAEGGQLVTDPPGDALLACIECARAVALGWWGSIARHIAPLGRPVCVLCSEGEATLTADAWFTLTASLVAKRTADGQRRGWREDAVKGLGAVTIEDSGL